MSAISSDISTICLKCDPNLSEVMEPIRNLTCKEIEWKWTPEHDAALKRIKEMATTSPLLKYYNPEDALTIQCDASEKGLGAAILQKGQPVAFASRALTDTESRYVQIERNVLLWSLHLTSLSNNLVALKEGYHKVLSSGQYCSLLW